MDDKLLRDVATLNPVREADVPDGHSPSAEALLERLTHDTDPVRVRPHRPRRPRPLWLLAPAAALLLLGAAWLLARPAEHPQVVSCYEAANPSATVVATPIDLSTEDPVDVCLGVWAEGNLFGPSEPPDDLAPCVTEAGTIAVVPGESAIVCGEMGWMPVDLDGTDVDAARLSMRLSAVHLEHECLDAAEARAIAEEALEELGVDGWDVVDAAGTGTQDACMTVAVQAPDRRLLIVPGLPPQ